MLVAY
ncbi:4590b769-7816-454e-a89c-485b11f43ad1 [Thermothielavioides terrestris]